MPTATPTPPTVIILSQLSLVALLDAVDHAHRQELTDLALRADEVAARSRQDDSWTETPGTDALAAMRPDMVLDFTTDTIPQSRQAADSAPRARELAAARWGLR